MCGSKKFFFPSKNNTAVAQNVLNMLGVLTFLYHMHMEANRSDITVQYTSL